MKLKTHKSELKLNKTEKSELKTIVRKQFVKNTNQRWNQKNKMIQWKKEDGYRD